MKRLLLYVVGLAITMFGVYAIADGCTTGRIPIVALGVISVVAGILIKLVADQHD